jgi:hypothetical protein
MPRLAAKLSIIVAQPEGLTQSLLRAANHAKPPGMQDTSE